ncbi:MAG: hypothetical protein ISP62_01050 [Cryomorphaceae bacterium]|nr:hypothetical protein [Cryomorphaceae bacterium]
MNQKENFVDANKDDSYYSIINKILTQSNINDKFAVYHMFEYVKPEIVHSELFLEYLRIWDNDFYIFLFRIIKKNKKRDTLKLLKSYVYDWLKKIEYLIIIIFCVIFYILFSIISIFLATKFIEFLVKFLNGNLENFNFLNLIG